MEVRKFLSDRKALEQQMVTSSMNVNASASEGSGRSGVSTGDWSRKDPCYKVAKKLRIVSCSYMEKKVSDKHGYLAEEISKQSLGSCTLVCLYWMLV